ncbi:hypothetical protein Pint_26830 [Pistacia integerrima]|uniref:Uncharacterized protein n=1 Tax=Pistacia integerrima TaxID=434235 RepID=A0ACC0YSI6_9ROSI|nr:hypothetical protein Pint_26830 [Pistacia integerrima]
MNTLVNEAVGSSNFFATEDVILTQAAKHMLQSDETMSTRFLDVVSGSKEVEFVSPVAISGLKFTLFTMRSLNPLHLLLQMPLLYHHLHCPQQRRKVSVEIGRSPQRQLLQ